MTLRSLNVERLHRIGGLHDAVDLRRVMEEGVRLPQFVPPLEGLQGQDHSALPLRVQGRLESSPGSRSTLSLTSAVDIFRLPSAYRP